MACVARFLFPAFLVMFGLLYIWRMSGVLEVDPVTNHLSNFYLSGAAFTLLVGPMGFKDASRRRLVLAAASVLVAVNVFVEVVLALLGVDDEVNDAMGNVNTSDPIDGLFGVCAVLIVFLTTPWRGRAP